MQLRVPAASFDRALMTWGWGPRGHGTPPQPDSTSAVTPGRSRALAHPCYELGQCSAKIAHVMDCGCSQLGSPVKWALGAPTQ